jgi:2-oxoisovalerate dehydrogenase E2 component (dihydrolipoyl transacylase)
MMGIHTIKMPDIGEGIAEVELVAWYVKVGDSVAEDQILADVMTDKATVEIPSPVAGTVLSLGGAVGQVMAVGSDLIQIEVEGIGKSSPHAPRIASSLPPEGADPAWGGTAPDRSSAPATVVEPTATVAAPPPAQREAAAATGVATVHARASGDKPIAAPAVRRRAWDLGIELQFVPGTGAAGRITQQDLDAYAGRAGQATSATQADQRYAQRSAEESIPVIGLRRKIAQKMQEAKRRIPHFTYVEEIDVTELEALRTRLNAKYGTQRPRLTLMPFLVRAVVLAVREFPQVNARYDDEGAVVTRYAAVHLGVATQTDGGLMVPVLRAGPRRQGRTRGTDRIHHHYHQPRSARRHCQHPRHQPPRGGHRGREPHGRATHDPQWRGGGAADDEPVFLFRPSRGGRHARRRVCPTAAGLS